MTKISLSDIKNLPKLEEFRFDVDIENYDGEKEDIIAAFTSKVVEKSNGIDMFMYIPEMASTGYVASLIASLQNIASISIAHKRGKNDVAFTTLHRIIAFNGWSLEGNCERPNHAQLMVSYGTEVSFPIAQPVEGLNEWLKEQGDKE